ncbi:LysR substrate-binding domain-containing protein [Primorskyibacter sp. 2E233]|uniref:LysR substrate-binding domain-containing protein n=1 Tax=Primorskyibacter sp. 2E233 TaxID=3413431 RepID=UPI003BF2DC6B
MALSHIRMRHLRCFLAVARHGSATKAAEALGTVQPGVSRSLRELEDEIGTPLFDRSAQGLVLNEAGRTLFTYVSGGIDQLDRGFDMLRNEVGDHRVTAYVLPNVVRMIMPGAVRRFKSIKPEVDLNFLTATIGGLKTYLTNSEIDFGFGRLLSAEHMHGMNFEHLFSEPLVFFARAGHPLASRRNLSIQEIDRHEVVLPTSGTIIRAEIDRFVIGQGIQRFSNLIETLSFEFGRNYITMSDAIACHPLGALRRELDAGDVIRLDFAAGALMGSVGLTTPAARGVSATAGLLMQTIRDEVTAQGLS